MNKSFFDEFRSGDYQRDNFDNFLEHIGFSYNVPSIHIAGTNGKGSTATYLANIYSANGYKTGLFISPFLNEPNEMISINGNNISDDDFIAIINRYKKDITKYQLSPFEIQTFVAFTYFMEKGCDISIIECGMGGETDATNIFKPVLSIITSISLEHTDFLGYSISEIAQQKAGIIKEEVPVLISEIPQDALTVISSVAKENDSKILSIGHYVNKVFVGDGFTFDYGEVKGIKIRSLADYSVNDACLALEALYSLKERFPFDGEKVKEGLAKAFMPCRLEVVHEHPRVITDGAHNPEATKILCQTSLRNVVDRPLHIVFACFRDKNLGNMLSDLGSVTDDLCITTFDNPRARTEDEYFLFLGDYQFEGDAKALIKRKMEEFPDDIILVTGSLAFAAFVRKWFKDKEL